MILQFDCQFGKTMEPRTPRIHQLKGKARPQQSIVFPPGPSREMLVEVSQNLPQMSIQTSKPILIRYIDPRLVPIFREFNSLTSKCQEIVQIVRESPEVPQKDRIEQLLQSTKKINDQFHSIIDETSNTLVQPFQQLNQQAETLHPPVEFAEIKPKQKFFNAVETVTRATDRINGLEQENQRLKNELEKEKKRAIEAESQARELRQKLARMQKQKKEMLLGIRMELSKLKDDSTLLHSVPCQSILPQ